MRLTVRNFKKCFGGMTRECRQEIARHDFSYDIVAPPPQNAQKLTIVGDRGRWEKGWSENLEAFRKSYDINDLTPKYYHPGRILRYGDSCIMPQDPDFEFNFLKVFRRYMFSLLKKYNPIYEFGCGTGFNLVTLGQMYPDKELHGLDWAESSMQLLGEINGAYGLKIKSHQFDMFTPCELDIPDNSAVFTWGALEQLGDRWGPFLEFLLSKNVSVINIEPIAELYDANNEMDRLSLEYMRQRGYLRGYFGALWNLESERRITIHRIQRQYFGNVNYEGWSFVTWKPRPRRETIALNYGFA